MVFALHLSANIMGPNVWRAAEHYRVIHISCSFFAFLSKNWKIVCGHSVGDAEQVGTLFVTSATPPSNVWNNKRTHRLRVASSQIMMVQPPPQLRQRLSFDKSSSAGVNRWCWWWPHSDNPVTWKLNDFRLQRPASRDMRSQHAESQCVGVNSVAWVGFGLHYLQAGEWWCGVLWIAWDRKLVYFD